jgi:hypothetical protein
VSEKIGEGEERGRNELERLLSDNVGRKRLVILFVRVNDEGGEALWTS